MRTRIAILTDIHGNARALRAALADIDQQPEIAHLYVLGDLIGIGPDTNEVLDLVVNRAGITLLRGNHEDAVLAILEGRILPGHESEHHTWIAAGLDRAYVPRLAGLPYTVTPTVGGTPLLLLHYHLHEARPLEFAAISPQPNTAELEARYGDHPARAVCFGHHHPLHLFRSPQRLYLNPGALGCCDRPVARYAVLTCDGPQIGVELRAVPYDQKAFLDSFDRLQVPDRDFLRQQLMPAGGATLSDIL